MYTMPAIDIVDMLWLCIITVFTREDKILIKGLHRENSNGVKESDEEFANKN